MKKLLSILPFLLITLTAFAEEECSLNDADKVDQLAEQSCDVVDRMATCAQQAPDPDAMKRRIESLINNSEKEKDKVQKYWNSYKDSFYGQMFDYDKNQANSDKSYVPEHLMDWFTDEGKADLDLPKFKEKMVENYVDFAKKNDCTPLVKHRYVTTHYPQKNFNTEKEIKDLIATPTYAAERDQFFKDYNAKSYDRGTYCEKSRVNTQGFHYVSEEFPPCAGNVSGLFKDNQWTSSTLDQKVGTAATDEVTACIQDRISKGAKIHHIAVVSSASSLNNTGEAAKKFCKKGFLALSQARAESARDKILPALFSKAGQANTDYQSKVVLNFNGSNGDGTSGPCPYTIKNGVEVMKDEYKTPAGKKELDDSKYVQVQVTFEKQTKSVNDNKAHYAGQYYCRSIYFECAPVQASAPVNKQ
jgi:hypothetical protein